MRKITGKILTYDTEFNGILKDGKNILNGTHHLKKGYKNKPNMT